MADRGRISLAAGVVVYRPEADLLERLVFSLAAQVDLLFLFCNSPIPVRFCDLARTQADRIRIIGESRNLGLGVAYNQIVHAAMARGIERILLFDQDSSPPAGLGTELLDRMERLTDAGERPAVVGPRPIAEDGTPYRLPPLLRPVVAQPMGFNAPLQFVISSGSLINGSAFRDIGPFREDFFIDAIDIEWCLRARCKGYTCWMASDVRMNHRLGAGVVRIPLSGVRMVRQPAARAYTFVRNQLALLRLEHVPPGWKARATARLIAYTVGQAIYASQRRATVRLLARGWRDGLSGRLGPPRTDAPAATD